MMINQRLEACFQRPRLGKVLIPFITTGYPSLKATLNTMHAMVQAGADIIELGVPFSDPAADGAVIQAAGEYALSNGTNLHKVLDLVADFRATDAITPIVLMGYANPIERMGQTLFVKRAAEVGVDGVLVVDYPPEVSRPFQSLLKASGIAQIFLLSPTTSEDRIKLVGELASGYVYYVSLKGVTGAGHLDTADVAAKLSVIRRHISIPVGVGFGIRDAQSARQVAEVADAVVIGSRLIQEITSAMQESSEASWDHVTAVAAAKWLGTIRHSLDNC